MELWKFNKEKFEYSTFKNFVLEGTLVKKVDKKKIF